MALMEPEDEWIAGVFSWSSAESPALGLEEIRLQDSDEISLRSCKAGWIYGGIRAKAYCVLKLLAMRDLHPTEEQVDRVKGCTDPAVLDFWFDLALTATRAGEVFAD
jgi:hypothetical protein